MTDDMMAASTRSVTGGVDTHKDFHVGVVVDGLGRSLGQGTFAATPDGYAELLSWMGSCGELGMVGVEGTGSWGAGLTRFLTSEGVQVVEVLRPNRQDRRRNGKTDSADAYAAAITALTGKHSGVPKSQSGTVESIRVLNTARTTMIRSKTATMNQIKSLLDTGPPALRESLAHKTNLQVTTALRAKRPGTDLTDPATATIVTLRGLARRWEDLRNQINSVTRDLETLTVSAAPHLSAVLGVGPITAANLLVCVGDNPDRITSPAAFAALCGAAPVPANSGRTQNRWRLNRGGNRQANSALWRIAITRMACDPRTRAYVTKRTAEGKTRKETIRCLKTYIARELYPIIQDDLA